MTKAKERNHIDQFTSKLKRLSNIVTIALLTFAAYAIGQWHKSMGIDNFINVTIAFLIMTLNMKLYNIYVNLCDNEKNTKDQSAYKNARREYYQLMRIAFWMTVVIVFIKIFS